jgi:hypothetical protein
MELVEFELPYDFGNEIALLGSFNNWDLNSKDLIVTEGRNLELELDSGVYYYKFLVDNQFWCNDPQAKGYVSDGKEAINSVLHVGEDTDELITNKDYGQVIDISLANQFKEDFLLNKGQAEKKPCFNCQDHQIYIYNTIKNFVGEIELSYVWCKPDLGIYNAESTLLQGIGGEQRLYNYINLRSNNLQPGQWKVFILANGLVIEEVEFLLKSNFCGHQNGKVVVR